MPSTQDGNRQSANHGLWTISAVSSGTGAHACAASAVGSGYRAGDKLSAHQGACILVGETVSRQVRRATSDKEQRCGEQGAEA